MYQQSAGHSNARPEKRRRSNDISHHVVQVQQSSTQAITSPMGLATSEQPPGTLGSSQGACAQELFGERTSCQAAPWLQTYSHSSFPPAHPPLPSVAAANPLVRQDPPTSLPAFPENGVTESGTHLFAYAPGLGSNFGNMDVNAPSLWECASALDRGYRDHHISHALDNGPDGSAREHNLLGSESATANAPCPEYFLPAFSEYEPARSESGGIHPLLPSVLPPGNGVSNAFHALLPPVNPPHRPPTSIGSADREECDSLQGTCGSQAKQFQFSSTLSPQERPQQPVGARFTAPSSAAFHGQSPRSTRASKRTSSLRASNLQQAGARTLPGSQHCTSAKKTSSLRLSQITPVRDALAYLKDTSSAINALHRLIQTCMPSALQSCRGNDLEQVLSFGGFPMNVYPDPTILTALPKADLDNLAWAFALNKNGRKADIARRVIQYLRSPISWAIPTKRKFAGTTPSNVASQASHAAKPWSQQRRTVPSRNQPYSQTTSTVTTLRPSLRSGSGRDSRPPTVHNDTSSDLYNMLVTQIRPAQNTSCRDDEQQDVTNTRKNSLLNRPAGSTSFSSPHGSNGTGKGQCAFLSLLQTYKFMQPENPFNIPMKEPLGNSESFVLFTSEQFGTGIEPRLSFASPQPCRPEDGIELQVHLRCLRAELGEYPDKWKQCWPFPAIARVNGHQVHLNQAQRYTSGKLAGIDSATNISPFLRKHKPHAGEANEAILRRYGHTAAGAPGTFVLFVQEIGVKSCELVKEEVLERSATYWQDHYKRFRAKLSKRLTDRHGSDKNNSGGAAVNDETHVAENISNFELAKKGVVQFMNSDDVMSSSMKVSLRCPLMLTRISIPVKGRKCLHVQCFDLEFFLKYTRRSSKFLCPVCNNPNAFPDDLVVSPYIEKALEVFDCDDVEISSDGSLRALQSQRNGVCSDDDEDEFVESKFGQGGSLTKLLNSIDAKQEGNVAIANESGVRLSGVHHAPDITSARPSRSMSAVDVVDLTLSDDDGADGITAANEKEIGDVSDRRSYVQSEVPRSEKEFIDYGQQNLNKIAQDAETGTDGDPLDSAGMLASIFGDLVTPDTNFADSCDVIALDSE